MADHAALVAEEIAATLERAGFETLAPDSFRVEVTDSFRRKLGECRPVRDAGGEANGDADGGADGDADGAADGPAYEIRIARRLFEDDRDVDWRDTVRHEVAHAHVFSTRGRDVRPHGEAWKAAARRAGADPTARYEGEDIVDEDYVLACPDGCYERGYLKRSKRIKRPWRYACPECETPLVSYDAADVPATLEPGTCHVASIPWDRRGDVEEPATTPQAPYLLACPAGCVTWPYRQRSKRIKRPWLYACPECGTDLVSCDGGDAPTDYEPGTCNVESIAWTEPEVVHACPEGCFSVPSLRPTEETRSPGQYRCEDCGARTISYPYGERPADPSPGTNYTG